ncbi:MAG TPA: hypothetical protein DCP89_04805 [Acidimicrobiaceae bacterium]|mgnify:FL=1|nr:hypothetical protein [Actinomycetota bacterium]HAN07798.1 hypothetical protein [Acidimicrobiaceae bacterium]
MTGILVGDHHMFNASQLAERLSELVQIPSVNPLQAGPKSGDNGEREISEWMANRCEDLGATVATEDILDGRHNVYARFEGTSDRSLTIDVHLDTVGVEHMSGDPFDGRIEDSRVYGRGSVDTKATLAIALAIIEEMKEQGNKPKPTINLVGTISEEMGGLIGAVGYRDWLLSRHEHIDQIIVAEPTMCSPVYGHKGGVGLDITVLGHAAHSSKPHLGKNAISAAARIVTAIDAEQARLQKLRPSTAVGNGSVSVTEIEGGLARNIIPDRCFLYVGRRTSPGEDPAEIQTHLEALIRSNAVPLDVQIENTYGTGSPAFYQDPSSDLVTALSDIAGTSPDTADYGSNALRYPEIATEVVVFGPGSIDQAHQAVEWIDLDQLDLAASIYRKFFNS